MAHNPPDPESKGNPAGSGPTTSMLRWARVFWIGVLVLVLTFVIVHLAGGGLGGHHGFGP